MNTKSDVPSQQPFERDPYYETTEEWPDDPVCDYCDGDGCDPFSDYVLPCPYCGGFR